MTLTVLLTLALILAGCGYIAAGCVRARRTPPELHGDWWSAFEREFRAYAARVEKGRRQPGER
jgi:hypothetical protein